MRTKNLFLSAAALVIMLSFLYCQSPEARKPENDVLFQYGVLGFLMEGVYNGELTCSQLKEHGDFGLGTFNTLDGEMVVINHQVMQIKADGSVHQVQDTVKTPFAVVTPFESDQTVSFERAIPYDKLKTAIDSLLPTKNIPFAIKISGVFRYMKTRSVPAQNKPYPRLLDVLKEQPVFEFKNIAGTIVGFRLPDYMDGANAPGYHFHFITEDMNAGGHVLNCIPKKVKIEIDYSNEWHTLLPGDNAFYTAKMHGDKYQ